MDYKQSLVSSVSTCVVIAAVWVSEIRKWKLMRGLSENGSSGGKTFGCVRVLSFKSCEYK